MLITRPAMSALVVLAALASSAVAQSAPASRASIVQQLDSIANSPILEGRAAGIGVAVVKGNDTLLMKGYGKANVEWDVPMPADAMFEVGSIAKQFTAAAILQLRDEGKLSLDDDITKFLPDFNTRGHKVTIRRMMDHTSGMRGLTEIPDFRYLVVSSFPRDSAYALINRTPFQFAPGEAMIYNNSAFWLLGLVVEKASGMSYEDYVEKKIFAPLGMTRSSYCNSSENVPRRAQGYGVAQPHTFRRAPTNVHTWPFAAGSICSTPGDLVTWLQALHGGKVLTPKSYTEMTSPSKLNDGTPIRYGMGLSVGRDMRGLRTIGHGGSITGFTAEATWYPDSNLAVVVLMNSNGPIDPGALGGELAAEVMPWTRPTIKWYLGDAAPLVGRYVGASRGRDMTVTVTQGTRGIDVSVNGAPARPLQWVDGLAFRLGNSVLTFRRPGESDSGAATELRYDAGGGYYILKRQP